VRGLIGNRYSGFVAGLSARTALDYVLPAAMVAVVALLAAIHHLNPHLVVDTPQYLGAAHVSWPGLLAGMRLPLYGWIVDGLTLGAHNYRLVPLVQTALFFFAAFALYRACIALRLSRAAALALALSVVLSDLLLFWANALIPEIFGAAFAILALSCALRMVRGDRIVLNLAFYSAALCLAYVFRPIYVPQILAMPIIAVVLSRLIEQRWNPRLGAAMLAAGLAPFLALSAIRADEVSDFNIVSFAGYQMSGMASQMMVRDGVARLPADIRPLALRIAQARETMIARRELVPEMPDAAGRREFFSRAVNYYDTFALNYDIILWRGILGLREPNQSWVDFNRQLQRYSFQVIRAMPQRYLGWVIGGAVRLTGQILILNPPLQLATLLLIALCGAWIVRGRPRHLFSPVLIGEVSEFHVLLVVVPVYTVAVAALPVLMTYPAARYVACTEILLAALPAYPVLRYLEARFSRRVEPTRRRPVAHGPSSLEHLAMTGTAKGETPKSKSKQDKKVDEQEDESFPASDPPSYAGGSHAIGAPKERETPQPGGDAPKSK
jgi:hypothetical protein